MATTNTNQSTNQQTKPMQGQGSQQNAQTQKPQQQQADKYFQTQKDDPVEGRRDAEFNKQSTVKTDVNSQKTKMNS